MKDRTRLIRTPNARIDPFCEVCGRVDGPLPFGRGDVALTYSVNGARCQDHPLPIQGAGTYEELLVAQLGELQMRQQSDDDRILGAFLTATSGNPDVLSSFMNALEG